MDQILSLIVLTGATTLIGGAARLLTTRDRFNRR